jgi:hypothetical protein
METQSSLNPKGNHEPNGNEKNNGDTKMSPEKVQFQIISDMR